MRGVPKLETIYLRRADSRLDALFGRLSPASERIMSRPPEAIRHDLASAERSATLFVHVPKAAGLSISQSLYGSRSGGHVPYYQYLWTYGARRMRGVFKFSFVRDPQDRLISAYSFLAGGGKAEEDRVWADENLRRRGGIDRFIQEDLVQPGYLASLHFRPQSFFLADPRTGRPGMDFIGRFESIGEDSASSAICSAARTISPPRTGRDVARSGSAPIPAGSSKPCTRTITRCSVTNDTSLPTPEAACTWIPDRHLPTNRRRRSPPS